MKNFLHLIFVSLVTVLLLESCVPSKPVDDIELLPSERLINKLEANRRKIRNFEGSGTIQIESDIYNNSAQFHVIMQKPDSIYFTILGPFGIELAQALVTNEEYVFYDGIENTAYSGEVNDDVLRNIFKINLSFSDLLDAFIGSVNLTNNLYKQPDEYSVDYDKYVLTYIDSVNGIRTTYRVDIRELGITDYSLKSEDGRIDIEGKYSNFELLESVAFPFVIEVNNKAENQKVTINYRNVISNDKNIHIDFILPDDVTMVTW